MENQIQPKKYSPILKWSLIIGIVVVVNMFFNYAISLIYSAPQYDNYCKQTQVVEAVTTKDACIAKGGQWNENVYPQNIKVPATPTNDGTNTTLSNAYCDLQFTCNNNFQADSKTYERNVFVTLVVLGVILVALSFVLVFNLILSVSASMGGILSIIIASMRYWSEANNWLKVGILFAALLALIYFAIRRFKD